MYLGHKRFWRGLLLGAQRLIFLHVNLLLNVNICVLHLVLIPLPVRKNFWLKNFKWKFFWVQTFFLSRIDPRPKTAILHIVSSCSRLNEFPFGPNSFPTKLNWKYGKFYWKIRSFIWIAFVDYLGVVSYWDSNPHWNFYRFVSRYVYHFTFFVWHVREWGRRICKWKGDGMKFDSQKVLKVESSLESIFFEFSGPKRVKSIF